MPRIVVNGFPMLQPYTRKVQTSNDPVKLSVYYTQRVKIWLGGEIKYTSG